MSFRNPFKATIPDFVPVILTWMYILSPYLFTGTTHTVIEGLQFPCNKRDLIRHLKHVRIRLRIGQIFIKCCNDLKL